MHAVVLPILDANMTHGVVRTWHKREGEVVQAGEPLFEVETDKVNAEVEADVSGVLRHIAAPEGTRVAVLAVVALVGAADEAIPVPEVWSALAPTLAEHAPTPAAQPPAAGSVAPPTAARRAATPSARRVAREHGIALETLHASGPRGEVTRADVEAVLSNTMATPAPAPSGSGRLDPRFLERVRTDAAAFRNLSSEVKVQLYREHGAHIGDAVRIEPGALILAAEISIGAASTVGADSIIECERLHLGRLVAFGRRTRVHCRSVEIGDALWSKDDVVIGGGGSDEAGAHLVTGDACFFGEAAYLNTCHPLTLADEVCIGARAMLFTHSHWQSVLRGYPSLFGPIAIGAHVFIGNNAFVFPGVTIGAGATVMVNSFVALNVAPNTLVGGVPAQLIRRLVPPSPAEQVEIVRTRLLPELSVALSAAGYEVTLSKTGNTLDLGGGTSVQFLASRESAALPAARRAVVLTFSAVEAPPGGVTVFNLRDSHVSGVQDALSDEVREFCRRRGIRFRPFAWRHGVGHFEGERFCGRREP